MYKISRQHYRKKIVFFLINSFKTIFRAWPGWEKNLSGQAWMVRPRLELRRMCLGSIFKYDVRRVFFEYTLGKIDLRS